MMSELMRESAYVLFNQRRFLVRQFDKIWLVRLQPSNQSREFITMLYIAIILVYLSKARMKKSHISLDSRPASMDPGVTRSVALPQYPSSSSRPADFDHTPDAMRRTTQIQGFLI